jgi:hypothetical protein
MHKAYNKALVWDGELPPLERTPQSNEESKDAKIYTAKKDLAIYRRIQSEGS